MPSIMIVDACKPSLVMSSEVFKDKIGGANILVAGTGKQALEIIANTVPDMCVVDFDLPDVDGVTLIHMMRKTYQGPILLTAYPDKIVEEAVKADLFAFNDAGAWIAKPVKFDILSAKIDQFLLDKFRLGKRFSTRMNTMIVGKGAGRGKRAPKVSGHIVNLSLGGACIQLDGPLKAAGGDEMMLALDLPPTIANKDVKKVVSRAAAVAAKEDDETTAGARIRCVVAWVDTKGGRTGVRFNRLTDPQRKGLEELLRNAQTI